ncbi:MAG: hypothetical protein V4456_21300 [Bacteroidota bacterium]
MRWGIETFIDELKNKLKMEYFSGYSDHTILQDINCAVLKHTIPIRNSRTNPRDTQKYRYKDKPIVTKNNRDSF